MTSTNQPKFKVGDSVRVVKENWDYWGGPQFRYDYPYFKIGSAYKVVEVLEPQSNPSRGELMRGYRIDRINSTWVYPEEAFELAERKLYAFEEIEL